MRTNRHIIRNSIALISTALSDTKEGRRHFGLGSALAVLAVVLGGALGRPAPARAQDFSPAGGLTAAFDYSVEKRFGETSDGMLVNFVNAGGTYNVSHTTPPAPTSFSVQFTACASAGSIAPYSWTVNDWMKPEGQRFQHRSTAACDDFTYEFTSEGTYLVTLEVVDDQGNSASMTKPVVVQDWLIIGLGDSYGSGEGNPEKPVEWNVDIIPEWDDYRLTQADYQHTAFIYNAMQRIKDDMYRACHPIIVGECIDCCAAVCDPATQCPGEPWSWERTTCEEQDCLDCCLYYTIYRWPIAVEAMFFMFAIETFEALADRVSQLFEDIQTALRELRNAVNNAQPVWQQADEHRSRWSGQALAAAGIEDQDPRSSVTFVHAACSGHTIQHVSGWFKACDEDSNNAGDACDSGADCTDGDCELLASQVDEALALVGGREIDAVVVSAGGNDIEFSDILMSCIFQENCSDLTGSTGTFLQLCEALILLPTLKGKCEQWRLDLWNRLGLRSGAMIFEANVGRITFGADENRYLKLNEEFENKVYPERVYITEYPGAMKFNPLQYCSAQFGIDEIRPFLPGLTASEAAWTESPNGPLTRLNSNIHANADGFGWNYVDGIRTGFEGHAYCAQRPALTLFGLPPAEDQSWFVHLIESFRKQKDQKGVMHPNVRGHMKYRDRLVEFMRADMFVAGPHGIEVRAPEQGPLAWLLRPYTLDEGSSLTLDHNSFDPNDIADSPEPIELYSWQLSDSAAAGAELWGADSSSAWVEGVDDASGDVTLVVQGPGRYGNSESDSATAPVTVLNVAPVIDAVGATIDENGIATVSGSIDDPGILDTFTIDIDWGEGQPQSYLYSAEATSYQEQHRYLDDNPTNTPSDVYAIRVDIEDDDGGTGWAETTVTVNNLLPEITTAPATRSVQYSDRVIWAVEATDVAADLLEASTAWNINGGVFSPGLPSGLELVNDGCDVDVDTQCCTWTLTGVASMPTGTYVARVTVADDDTGEDTVELTLVVSPEDATVEFDTGNPVAAQVPAPGGNSGAVTLMVQVAETQPDQAVFPPGAPGDIRKAVLSMTLLPVGPGNPVTGACAPQNAGELSGFDYSEVLIFACSFDDLPVNLYKAEAVLEANNAGELYYAGSNHDVLVVFDPCLGFTTGGGHFYWPGTTDRTNWGHTMKYSKKHARIKGSLLLIRHLPDGSSYRVKSKALFGLAVGDEDGYAWASFTGKCTYRDPSMVEPVGNHTFVTYVEDHGKPGAGVDRFWLQVFDKDDDLVAELSMNETAVSNAETIVGGNIAAQHSADLDGDGQVRVADLIILLTAWGPNSGHPADLDGDGEVRVPDLINLLAAWGTCQ